MADFKIYLTKMSLAYQGSEEERLCGDLLFSEKDIQMGDKRLNNLAAYTYNSVTCQKLFIMIEKALTPTENPWKTIYKSLLLLHTIVLFGSELAIDKAIDLCRFVRPLGTYNSALAKRGLFSGGGGTDYGAPVRAAAKTVDEILLTDASIRKARLEARQGQASLVPMGELLDDGSAAAAAAHNREFNPSHGVQMNYGQGLTTSVGAGFGLQAVPGMYEGRPERYFDSDSTRKHLLQPKSVLDSQITRDAQAPSLLDMVFDDTASNMANLPPADYLPALEKQRELEAQLLAQQEQLRQLQDLQREQQRLQELQRAQQQQQTSLLQFPFTAAPVPGQQGQQGPGAGAPYGGPGAPSLYSQPSAGSMGQPYQQGNQFQGMGMGMGNVMGGAPAPYQSQGQGQGQGVLGAAGPGLQQHQQQRPPQQAGAFDDLLGLSSGHSTAPQYGQQAQQTPQVPRQQPSPYRQPQPLTQGGGAMSGSMGGGMGSGMGYVPQQQGVSPAYGQGMGQQGHSPFSPMQSPPNPQHQLQGQGFPLAQGQAQGYGGSPYGAPSQGLQQSYASPQAQQPNLLGQPAHYQPNQGVGYNGLQQQQQRPPQQAGAFDLLGSGTTHSSYQQSPAASYPPPQQQNAQGYQGQHAAPPVPDAPMRAPPPVPSSMPTGPPPPVPTFAPPF